MSRVVIGCPIRDRAWAVNAWLDFALDAAFAAESDVHFVFVAHPDDQATIDAIRFRLPEDLATVVLSDETHPVGYRRTWDAVRFSQMASLRNQLLAEVRDLQPDLFWSLDSDILAHPRALTSAVDLVENSGYDAVGQACFMTTHGTTAPSYGMLIGPSSGLKRPWQEGQFEVDVIMASKVMTPAAFDVDYVTHRLGEDIGWSLAARARGCRLGWDSMQVSKHVMRPEGLWEFDERCGY